MLATMYKVTCEVCGGEDAPIISGKHADIKFCHAHLARTLLFSLLKAHEDMIKHPDYFSKDNPTKQSYYCKLNHTLELLEKGLANE